MDPKRIADVFSSLSERPLAEGRLEGAPELANLTHAARLAMPTDAPGAAAPDISVAALAALLSSTASEADQHRFVDVAAQSTSVRLDAESALAFVEGIEQSMTAAPAHLVNEMLAGGSSDAAQPVPGHGMSAAGCIRSAIFGNFGNLRRWQVATACAVLVLAGGLAWSLREPAPDAAPTQPAVATIDDACATRDAVTIAKTGRCPATMGNDWGSSCHGYTDRGRVERRD